MNKKRPRRYIERKVKEMKTIEYRFIDKTSWPEGEWNDEPDKVQWQDEETQLPCLAKRNPMGAWCGYVGIAEGHPLFGQDYDSQDDLEIHGGLTFSGFCQEDDKEHGICHMPDEGEPDRIWWLGFDCAHGLDLMPISLKRRQALTDETYKTLDYVRAECANLAHQLIGIYKKKRPR